MTSRKFLQAVGLAVLAAMNVVPSYAQTATTDRRERFVRTLQFRGDQPALKTTTIYTVPAGKFFRVTDLWLTNGSTNGACLVTIGGAAEINVAPVSTMIVNVSSGETFGPGDPVYIGNNARIGGGSNFCSLTYTVMGYQFERP